MFKGFNNSSIFSGVPRSNFGMDKTAYNFGGAKFWLDAAFGLNTQTDLAAISSWTERLTGFSFLQATAGNQPRLVLNDPNFNNLPSIQAADSSRWMEAISGGLEISPNFTAALVVKSDSFTGLTFSGLMGTTNAEASTLNGFKAGGSSTLEGFGFLRNNVTTFQTGSNSTAPSIVIMNNNKIFVNGSLAYSASSINQSTTLRLMFRLGGNNGWSFIGRIAEVVAFERNFSDTEALELSTRLNSKYNLY
jgi:hypothetical protein